MKHDQKQKPAQQEKQQLMDRNQLVDNYLHQQVVLLEKNRRMIL
jgi:hypothetical protein